MIVFQSHRSGNAGLTLLELLVVLGILAVLSTVAMRSVVGTFEEKNYEANVAQLEEIKQAVLGDDHSAGFLGDIGRLPLAVGDADATNYSQLAELWDQDEALARGISLYAIRTPAGDAEIRLGTGWRGPYLDLGINRNDLTDGFANRYFLLQADGTESDNGEPIAIVQTLGADGAIHGASYAEDLEVIFEANAGVLPPPDNLAANDWQTDLQVTVTRDGGPILLADGAHLILRAYGADGLGGLHTVLEEKFTLTADLASHTFTLSNLPHGAKVLRAYQESADPADKETPLTTTSPERKSPATHVVIDRFSSGETLTLY